MSKSIIHTERFYEKRRQAIESKTKVCTKCRIEKDKREFPADPTRRDGRYAYCNSCKAAYQRELLKKNLDKFYKSFQKWNKNNPEKRRAHKRVGYAVKTGKLKKPEACQRCGNKEKRLEAHHWHGYSINHIYDVQWLCHPCHEAVA